MIRRGRQVRFIKTSRVLADLAAMPTAPGNGGYPTGVHPPPVLILDNFAMRELTANQADDLYELVSERAAQARPLILTSKRAPTNWYALLPNPVVTESLLDR